jgi:hypothetical protein
MIGGMKMNMKEWTLGLLLAAGLPAAADNLAAVDNAGAASSPARAAFEKLKTLDGQWEGDSSGQPVNVTYRLASNGSVVLEDLFPGTSHEMITMYHLDGDAVAATHYCAMGNQPRMRLNPQSSTATELHFDFAGGTNFAPETDVHVHSGVIRFVSADRIESTWAVYKGTSQIGANKFLLARKK